MALIRCPECGREVSDRAAACPNCAAPIKFSNTIKIKFSLPSNLPGAVGRTISVFDKEDRKLIWQGTRGQTATITITRDIRIDIMVSAAMGRTAMVECPQSVSPGKKYNLTFIPATMFRKPRLVLTEVEVLDSD